MKRLIVLFIIVLAGCDLTVEKFSPSFTVKHDGEYYVFLSNNTRLLLTWGEGTTTWEWHEVSPSVGEPGDVVIDVQKVLGPAYPDGDLVLQLYQGKLLEQKNAPIGIKRAKIEWQF